jgi:hypothetical protein
MQRKRHITTEDHITDLEDRVSFKKDPVKAAPADTLLSPQRTTSGRDLMV